MSHQTPTKYAAALRTIRRDAKVRQKDLAAALDMHRALLSDVERGKRLPFHVSRTRQIAEHLQADPTMLMSLAAADRGIDPEALEGLSPADLEDLIKLILDKSK